MATIIWKESNPRGTAKSRYKARRAAMVAERRDDEALARKVAVIASGCNMRVGKAVTSPSLRDRHESGAACLPEVALYAAGYRKSESVTAR